VKVAIAGASGFVGSALAAELSRQGHDVRALTRRPDAYRGAGSAVRADITDPASLTEALADQDAAYYLVHSLAGADFADQDRAGAHAFADAASAAELRQIVYLGGLGEDSDDLSEHLRSRREVESILMDAVPTTALRAGIVIGDGSISWEILRQLVTRLPVMVTPRWVETRTQPIGLDDALIVPVPFLSPRLSSHWLRLITDVDLTTAQALVDSMTNEVVVRDNRIRELLDHQPVSFEAAVADALRARDQRGGAALRARAPA
jgi:nucleoside-diphosphate-sugar epimerase